MSMEVSPCPQPEDDDALNNATQFLKMQPFRAALSANLRKVMAQRNPNTLTLDDMYQIATDTQREAGLKIKEAVTAIHPEEQDCSEGDEEIAAFQKRKGSKSTDRRKNSNPTTKTNFKGYSSVIDAPQSGLKGSYQTLNKLLRCATTPRWATAPSWQRPKASLKSRSETREVCAECNQTCAKD
jgi:hypothetical protein